MKTISNQTISSIPGSLGNLTINLGYLTGPTKFEIADAKWGYFIYDTATGTYTSVSSGETIRPPRGFLSLFPEKTRLKVVAVKPARVNFFIEIDETPVLDNNQFILPRYEITLEFVPETPQRMVEFNNSFSAEKLVFGHLHDIRQIVKSSRVGISLPYRELQAKLNSMFGKMAPVNVSSVFINIAKKQLDKETNRINQKLGNIKDVLYSGRMNELRRKVAQDLKKRGLNASYPQVVGEATFVQHVAKNIVRTMKSGATPALDILLKKMKVSVETLRFALIMEAGNEEFGKAFDRLYKSYLSKSTQRRHRP